MKLINLAIALTFITACYCQANPTGIAWPKAWNATITVTMGDVVIGAPATSYYDSTVSMQATFFTQCATAGGIVNLEPCVQVQSSVEGNFGIWTIQGDSCCVNFNNVGFLAPEWPTTMDFINYQDVFGQSAIHFSGGGDKHDYYVTNDEFQIPLFVGPEEWTWPSGWLVGEQPDVFSDLMPISACNSTCVAA
eukprot:CAMPEP_0206156018 /NCGR_PEP_ID=MMETSP1474-20131121/2618_1 /ASSEMBLY_ACC=CAM_ASM_001110 /TAXON_ID=97495 /ORGANISM="Imantonia sp., Strain RCC918" /LENGTH=191 /DNA_ID=CAMNT_0053554907 /DNA_START=20 /DNA_END=595 /DNA_ORIENTATION=+